MSWLAFQDPSMQDSLSSTSSSGDSPTLSDCRLGGTSRQPQKPIPRKGHTKSRRGCFNCKRRRIKCNEKHPDCHHCVKAGLQCAYPVNIIQSMQRSPVSPRPHEVVCWRSTPGTFSMSDMRLFHHFLITAYPHLPVGGDRIWVDLIPTFAHNYEYVIHSILALAASHLDAVSNAGVAEQAIQHRILAVKSLKKALSVPPRTRCERDARMAAAIALAFQSSHLQDGLAEYLTMVRGCNLIAGDEGFASPDSVFHTFSEDTHLETIKHRIATNPQLNHINHADLDLATLSLHSVKHLAMSDTERTYHDLLAQTISSAYANPAEAYTTFVATHNTPSKWTHDEFQTFIDPDNSVALILLAHFIAIQATLTPILYLERVGFRGIEAPTAVLGWIEGIYGSVPMHLRGCVEWPRRVARYPCLRFLGQG
ncbi:hypothetical protein P153DRAFT_358884 [Dothidotthia symphoricarpi CBS 119687]|uniref:Zn(2)-C6 fungal-type domain-containing protein n=1 Tax=Dothidotthia symphoricarpi CBS 119687 TaxID=1392245 RepID=A0A6A6A7T8_9PLEO|nr:uncharacterized protein P153DRAFT_358884 [Dothidotthia symphoricarpi CBS 119687]KAF2127275.1 hypothetical protein P153DRAFT_358884 [Dothidotthia symphoricarpi CBS 119687]